jgi:peptide/nickel transport system substrate-binding protein
MAADTVSYALNHLLEAKVPARSFNPKSIKSIEAVGTNKIRITTPAANPLIPLYAASPSTAILSKKAFNGAAVDPLGNGSGPFILVKVDLPASISLKRNAGYWGGSVGLSDVEVRFVPDGNTRATMIRSGEVQVASIMPLASLPAIKSTSTLKLATVGEARTMSIYLNNAKAPFNDVRVRQALQSAIDVKSIANDLLEGNVAAATGPFVGGAPYAPTGAQPATYDTTKAQDLFKQAGIDPKTLTLDLWTYPERAELPSVAVAVQAMLKKLGITVNVRVAAYNSLIDEALAGRYQMFLVSRGYLQDLNDPASYLQSDYVCKGSYNLSQLCVASLDDQVSKAIATSDIEARFGLYRDLAGQLQRDAVAIYLFNSNQIDAYAATLQNYKMHPLLTRVVTSELVFK